MTAPPTPPERPSGTPGLREELQSVLGSAYTLERELTGGGMARVFAANETSLGRRVVVKILQPEMAEGVSATRFEREIRLAASLQQANIVPVLTTGAMNGVPFYTMPFVEGQSLRDRLRREGVVPLQDAIGILRDVARALAYAHDNRVVHRDIKPENILLSGHAAVVSDFGIAKAISAARSAQFSSGSEQVPASAPGETTGITRAGIVIGTPTYMAPEQASGEHSLDHRADIYSFGCVAYELLTGGPPFRGNNAMELFAAHLTEVPEPLTRSCPDCPIAITSLVMRCLEKDPSKRPQSTREILETLDSLSLGSGTAQRFAPLVRRTRAIAAIAAVAAALVMAVVLWPRQQARGTSAAAKSIAVLPLANVGGDSAQEYLADGMTDELSTAIGKLGGVRVASRSLARRYSGRRDVDVREAGQALNVAFVLQGTVRRLNDKLRVAATLTSASDGVEVWSEMYDRSPDDVFGLQDDITRGVAVALKLAGGDSMPHSFAHGTTDPVAYDLYLRGRYLLERRGAGVGQAIVNFRQAIARDSGFARAYAGLGLALELLPYFGGVPAADVRDSVMIAANRALALDSSLAEARVALGLAAMHANDWPTAGREFERAVALAPREQPPHLQYGRYLLYVNRLVDARSEFEIARQLDPYSALPSAWLGEALWLLGRPDEAMGELRRALQIDSVSGPAILFIGPILAHNQRADEARTITERMPKSRLTYEGIVAYVRAKSGDVAGARRIEQEFRPGGPKSRNWFASTSLALTYLGLGDTSRALTALERATDNGENWASFHPIRDPVYDAIRPSPRFAALLRRIRLQDAGLLAPRDSVRP